MTGRLELFLFMGQPEPAARAVQAGVDGIVIDWERSGKTDRQARADTEINEDTVDDLRRVRAATRGRVLCRVNPAGAGTTAEIELALEAGADEVLLPMVRWPHEVELALDAARGRIAVGILVETVDAVDNAVQLARLPITRVFLGLNDLAIERGSPSIFTALADGTVDEVRAAFSIPFGVAGVTVADGGHPLPCRLLIAELMRLRCDFTFLRRSFRRDTSGRDLRVEIRRIRETVATAAARAPDLVRDDQQALTSAIRDLERVAYDLTVV